jgi:hypothetical protein
MGELPVPTVRLVVRRFAAYRSDPEVARYQGWDQHAVALDGELIGDVGVCLDAIARTARCFG